MTSEFFDSCEEEIKIRLLHVLDNSTATKRYVDIMLNKGVSTLEQILSDYSLTPEEYEYLKLKYG